MSHWLSHGMGALLQKESRWRRREQTESPIPLLLSTGGWGIFVNTTWVHYYDIGRYEADKMFFWGPGGQLDFYLRIGDTLAKLIERYSEITGKPRLLPLFGYGLSYVGQITQNEHEILNDARLFRDRGIPGDLMGLEPQWMKKNHDASHEKEWNPDKFYIPAWMGPNSKGSTFIGGLDRIGFKLSLWLVCGDDLTMEEERQIAIREGRGKDFPAEPDAWFNHLQKFVRNSGSCSRGASTTPLAFPDDLRLSDCTTQYMLGDTLLVTAFSDKVLLPTGRWIDYWTGAEHQGPKEMPCLYPRNRMGGLFVRVGAIIPYWPEMDYVGEQSVVTPSLHVYPEGKSDYTLYEDDGDSFEYLKGAVARTPIRCDAGHSQVTLTIDPRQGSYRGIPTRRGYEVHIHMARPRTVTVTGGAAWSYSPEAKTVCLSVAEDPERKTPVVVQCGL